VNSLYRHPGLVAGAVVVVLALPPLRVWLEGSMAGHMLVQIPLLAGAGVLGAFALPPRLKRRLDACNARGLPFTLLASLVSTYWMLPRALDAALTEPWMEVAKFVSLPLLVGLPLALSWRRLGTIGQGFVAANFVSMVSVVGWLYIVAPARVCNNYLVDQQTVTGWLLVAVSGLLFLGWTAPAFIARERSGVTACVARPTGRATEKRSPWEAVAGRLR